MEKYEQRIREVLRRQNFIVGEREEDIIARRIRNGRRYFFMTAMRQEKDGTRERFVKIPRNDSKKLLIPFRRQLHITQYIQKRKGLLKTRAVIASNANPRQGIPYAVMETFPIHTSKIGFIEDNDEIRSLRARHGQKIVRQLHDFHNIRAEKLPRALQRTLVPYVKTYPRMRQ